MLDVQIQILSVDTGNFYYDDEAGLHDRNRVVRTERRKLINGYTELLDDKSKKHCDGKNELIKKLESCGFNEHSLNLMYKTGEIPEEACDNDDVIVLLKEYFDRMDRIKEYATEAKSTKNRLLELIHERVEYNLTHERKDWHVRELRENSLCDADGKIKTEHIISVFDSSFTRMIGARPNTFTDDFMVVQVYYFDIIKDLIYHGFTYKGERYIYFTSSAGQIRTKKCVFVKESVWNNYEKTIMCGLSMDTINQKGGNNPNKHLAYMALSNSATDVWDDFDIDRTIVIDDFETNVCGTYDLVDEQDYSINRVTGDVPIPHTDGAGMMLPKMGNNRMVRLPWIKGLLGAFDFAAFIQEHNCSPVIKDIYGKEHNIIAEKIQIVFTKSQFKMYKYYDSWDDYKSCFKQYGCTAGYTNLEENRIRNSAINYQMLQTLVEITDDEILAVASNSINRLRNMCSSVDHVRDVLGATEYTEDKTPLQKAICLYPNLLNDGFIRQRLRLVKNSMIKCFKAGKLKVRGKYTFILPDFYAACEYWFCGIENPAGLLRDGEVFCWLYRDSEKLDCLRSPHLYIEHAIRHNAAYRKETDRQKELRKWFGTNAIYTSCHDLISKILQFDVDGDKSLVVADKTIIAVAERTIQKYDVVPLYYNMRKAAPKILNSESIYGGLSAAFTGSNIGQYSNSITKIWNSEVFISGTMEERKRAIDIVKFLCMENNFKIDYAKTLYMPERPEAVKAKISELTNGDVPHFFLYAKDKELFQVEKQNNSFINKLDAVIPKPRISQCYIDSAGRKRYLAKPVYNLLLKDDGSNRSLDETEFLSQYRPFIDKYMELSKRYSHLVGTGFVPDSVNTDRMIQIRERRERVQRQAIALIKGELAEFGYDESDIATILIYYLYGVDRDCIHKNVFWICYGEYVLENIQWNLAHDKWTKFYRENDLKDVECEMCGRLFTTHQSNRRSIYCPECLRRIELESDRERKRKLYQKCCNGFEEVELEMVRE